MGRVREALARLAGALGRGRDGRIDEEVREHLRLLTDEYERRGLTPAEAARAARLDFGNPASARERWRDQRGLPSAVSVAQDLRYAARLLWRSPTFTIAAVSTLAIGIGVNTTLFTTINAVMFRPLPVTRGDRLVRVERWFASQARGNGQYLFSEPEYRYLGDHGPLADLVAESFPALVDSGGDEPLRVNAVSANYFDVLGAAMLAGRAFTAADPASEDVVVLSHPFWQRQYGGDPAAVGRPIRLNRTIATIVAIAPRDFIGTGNPPVVADAWAPIAVSARVLPVPPVMRRFQVLGHLSPEAALAVAGTQVSTLVSSMAAAFPAQDATTALTLDRATFFGETNDPRFQQFVAALMAIVGLVLLIACANIANMLLARAAGRQKEIATRFALGASRARVVRQLLTESVLLALAGGCGGLLLSAWGARVLWLRLAEAVELFLHGNGGLLITLSPDLRVFAYTFGVSLAAGLAFGLSPALRSASSDVNAALKEDGASAGAAVARSWLRSVLVGCQVAVSMALLLPSGLLLRGFDIARRAEPGYETTRLFALFYGIPDDRASAVRLQSQVYDRLMGLRQLAGVAIADRMPMAGTWTPPMRVQRQSGTFADRTLAVRASPEYFATVGVTVLRGRNFEPGERSNVAIISEHTAEVFWPGENPLGRTLTLDMNFRGKLQTFEVVGVAADVRTANLTRVDPSFVYIPANHDGREVILVRVAGDVPAALAAIRAALRTVDPDLAVRAETISIANGPLRLQKMTIAALTAIAGTLALLAGVLAVTGIYGVISYLAASRRREIGVRMALGATRGDILRLLVGDGFRPVAIGAVVGTASAVALGAVLRSLLVFPGTPDVLFGVNPYDPLTFVAGSALLAAVALGASASPLWRSTRVDPAVTLRHS
jgi:predicted permease